MSREEEELRGRKEFYEKMLYYCDLVGGPNTPQCADFIEEARQLLVRRHAPDAELLCHALVAADDGRTVSVLADAETEKGIKFMRADLGVSLDDIARWYEQQQGKQRRGDFAGSPSMPPELTVLREKERPVSGLGTPGIPT